MAKPVSCLQLTVNTSHAGAGLCCLPRTIRLAFLLLIALPFLSSVVNAEQAQSGNGNQNSDQQLDLADARHLLTRSGIGAHPRQLNQLIGLTREQAVEVIVDGINTTSFNPMPEWVNASAPSYSIRQGIPQEKRREFRRARNRELVNLRQWWVYELISTPTPQTERLVLFWHNHFVSAYGAINQQSTSIARQHQMFRQMGSGDYRDLLKQVIRDPAMLEYLDNRSNRKAAPNENLARELLELFTLGEGNYTEQDVKNAARALTGYSVSPSYNMQFRFQSWQHDFGEKELFGQRGNFNGDDLIDLILQQPAASAFITRKFWQEFISRDNFDTEELEIISTRFRQSDFDLKTLYRDILSSAAFWDQANRASLIKSPVDLVIGTLRSTGNIPNSWQSLPTVLASLGQNLFDAPNVAGWPGHDAWVTPDRLLARHDWFERYGRVEQNSGERKNNKMMTMTNSMLATGGNDGTVDKRQSVELLVHIAAEDFNGPAQYQLEVYRNEHSLWRSGKLTLAGGHDTSAFGRIRNPMELPWQQVAIQVPPDAAEADSISITFLNDDAGQNGDRNLYVDWVRIQDRLFMSSDGIQRSGCPPKSREAAGSLYCQGQLRIDSFHQLDQIKPDMTMMASNSPMQSDQVDRVKRAPGDKTGLINTNLTTNDNALSIGSVHLQWVRNPDNKNRSQANSDIAFTLNNVSFKGKQFDTIIARYVHQPGAVSDQGSMPYVMYMDSYSCWPDCLTVWPDCGWVNEHDPGHREVQLRIRSTAGIPVRELNDADQQLHGQCEHADLDPADQELMGVLIRSMPNFYNMTENSRKLDRKRARQFYNGWAAHVEKIRLGTRESHYAKADIQLTGDLGNSFNIVRQFFDTPPRALGRTSADYSQDLSNLQSLVGGLDLATLLLPVTGPSSPDSTVEVDTVEVDTDLTGADDLASILINPVFQLR